MKEIKIDKKQYDLVSNINVGQLFPKKWGLNIPFNLWSRRRANNS